jgi:Transcriptional regulator
MRKTKEEAEVTKEKLLDAALKVFSKKGYPSTTLDDIAKEAGVTRGAIYWHFKGGKAEIFTAIINKGLERVNTLTDRLISEGGTPMEILERVLVSLLKFVEEDDDYRAVQEILIFQMVDDPELSLRLEDKKHAYEESIGYIAGLIEQAKGSGEVRHDVDATTAAIAAYGMLNGVVFIWLVERSVAETPQFSLKKQASSFIKLYLRSIVA